MDADLKTHKGQPSVLPHGDGTVTILCPVGHVVGRVGPNEWAHSGWEARMSRDVKCAGAMPASNEER